MAKKIIAIDIDDVLAESTEAFRKKVNQYAGINLKPEDYKVEGPYWSYYESVWRAHNVAHLIDADLLHQQMHFDQSHIPLMPGAEFAINELQKRFDVILVTARDPEWKQATDKWLKEQFGTKKPALYFSEAHKGIDGAKTKGEICQDVGASWMIDDNPEHCQTVLDKGIKAILFGEYGWHVSVPKPVVRCKDWQAVLEYFENEI